MEMFDKLVKLICLFALIIGHSPAIMAETIAPFVLPPIPLKNKVDQQVDPSSTVQELAPLLAPLPVDQDQTSETSGGPSRTH